MRSALQCPRLTVHKHLVASLLLFYSSLLVYLEPYVTQRKQGLDYRQYVSIIRSTERGLLNRFFILEIFGKYILVVDDKCLLETRV
jgi:hypothetical protein